MYKSTTWVDGWVINSDVDYFFLSQRQYIVHSQSNPTRIIIQVQLLWCADTEYFNNSSHKVTQGIDSK